MNFLEEVIPPNLMIPQAQEKMVQHSLDTLMPDITKLKKIAEYDTKFIKKNTNKQQLDIIDELYEYNKELLSSNKALLHENIQKEGIIRANIEKVEGGELLHGSPDEKKELKHELQEIQNRIINTLEDVNFAPIAKITNFRGNKGEKSFHKLWMWILEIFYNTPSSKYDWKEFSRKVLKKDNGEELKRLIIIYKYGKLNTTEKFELEELNNLHVSVIKDYFNTVDLNNFMDVFKLIGKYLTVYEKYMSLKELNYDNKDEELIREEEKKVTKASAKFNSTKYDLITEMQNILFLVNHEFKKEEEA